MLIVTHFNGLLAGNISRAFEAVLYGSTNVIPHLKLIILQVLKVLNTPLTLDVTTVFSIPSDIKGVLVET